MLNDLLRNLGLLVPRIRRRLVAVAALATVAGLFEAVTLVCIVQVALLAADDEADFSATYLSDASAEQLLTLALGLVIVVLLLHYITARLHAGLVSDVFEGARVGAIDSYFASEFEHLSSQREGSLQESVSTLATQTANATGGLINLISSATQLGALLAVAFAVDPAASIVVLAFGGLIFLCLRPIALLTRRRASSFVRANATFSEDASALASTVLELKAFGVTESAVDGLRKQAREAAQQFASARFVNRLGSTLYRDLAAGFLIAAVAWIYWGSVNLAGVGAVVVLIVRAVSSAQTLQSGRQMLGEQQPSSGELIRRVDDLSAHRDRFGSSIEAAFDKLEFFEVGYSYGETQALNDVSFEVRRHEILGVVGPSGGGKTTLLQVLLRLRLPTSGTVRINGLDYTELSAESWSRLVAAVPQESRLIPGSIRHNVAFYRDVDDTAILEALERAHLGDTVAAMPDGLDTELGPRGAGLSGGQKQRIALARALVTTPELLVLDEPTSALDEASEGFVKATIEELRGTTTIVLVAHRPTTLEACTRLLEMRDGMLRPEEPK